jgi:hypothetical protein
MSSIQAIYQSYTHDIINYLSNKYGFNKDDAYKLYMDKIANANPTTAHVDTPTAPVDTPPATTATAPVDTPPATTTTATTTTATTTTATTTTATTATTATAPIDTPTATIVHPTTATAFDTQFKFVASKKTIPYKNSWRCANVPYKIVSSDKLNIKLSPFNGKSDIIVPIQNFIDEFYYLRSDDTYVYIQNYPNGRILISEFDIKPISIKKLKKYFEGNFILNAIEKAEQDSFHSKGNQSCATIDKYHNYISDPKTSKLERIGDPIFNRSVRLDFEKSPSYPAPIGIREEDFAFPSEQNEIIIELLNQIFSCQNAPECPKEIISELGLNIKPNSHICLWCGHGINISELNQEYCSKEHSINFCHRTPELGTKKGNVYFGHCSCNREQGGYSELEHIEQTIRLAKAKYNSSYREKILQELA